MEGAGHGKRVQREGERAAYVVGREQPLAGLVVDDHELRDPLRRLEEALYELEAAAIPRPETATAKTVRFAVNDGDADSSPQTRAIAVTRVDDPPVVDTTNAGLGYTENSGAVPVDPIVTLADVDSATVTGATVKITSNLDQPQDALAFTDQLGITGSYDDATGTLTLSEPPLSPPS